MQDTGAAGIGDFPNVGMRQATRPLEQSSA